MEPWEEEAPELPAWLAGQMPFRRRVARVGGYAVHFVDEGEGVPVVMVHGNPTWSYLWRHVIGRLAGRGLRLVAPDLVGLGLSSKPSRVEAHSLTLHVEMVAGLMDLLDLKRAVVVGQDWGGPIAAGAAHRRPERVAGAVFANTAIWAPSEQFRVTRFHKLSHMPLFSDILFRGLNFPVPVLHRVQGDRSSMGRAERRAYAYPLRRIRDRAAPLALARMVPNAPGHPSIEPLRACEVWARGFEGPSALVWGTRDPILGRALRRMRELFPGAVVTETQAGHFLQEEVPDVLADAIAGVAGRV